MVIIARRPEADAAIHDYTLFTLARSWIAAIVSGLLAMTYDAQSPFLASAPPGVISTGF